MRLSRENENDYFLRIIFEQNQADLEHSTEELSGYLERDLSQTNGSLTEMKQKVQDKYRYCSTRRKVLLDHVAEGYECDYWLVFIYINIKF
jgi:ariadne-1